MGGAALVAGLGEARNFVCVGPSRETFRVAAAISSDLPAAKADRIAHFDSVVHQLLELAR